MNWLANLRFSRKFALLGLLAGIATALPFLLYLRAAQRDLDFAADQQAGIPVMTAPRSWRAQRPPCQLHGHP